MRRGWTFIELLVAIALMTLVASVVTAVFHAVVVGPAQSSDRTVRYHRLGTTVERILSEIETGPCDQSAERLNGIPLRIESRSAAHQTASETLWFLTRADRTDADVEPVSAQVCYRVQPSGYDALQLQLVRQAWIIDDTLTQPPPENQAASEVVLSSLTDFQVDVWTVDGWTDQWPPSNETNALQTPEAVRVIVTLDDSRARPLAVTGTARRIASNIPVTDTTEKSNRKLARSVF